MPVDFLSFQNVAEESWSRVVLERSGGEEALVSDKGGLSGRKIRNAEVRQAFSDALRTHFGADVVSSLKYKSSSSSSLSSREIRNVIHQAREQARASNMARVLCLFSQRVMAGGVLQNPGAVSPESLKSMLGPMLDEVSPNGALLSDNAAGQLATRLIQLTRNAGARPRGIELLNGQRHMYNVEDKVKDGSLRQGDILGEFEFVRLKQKGVEPGFEAHMAWQPAHTQTMLTQGTPLNAQAGAFLKTALEGGHLPPAGAVAHGSLREMSALENDIRAKAAAFLQAQGAAPAGGDLTRGLDAATERALMNSLMNDADIQFHLKEHVRQNNAYFTDIHYVKMDYAESDKTLVRHRVRIPMRTAKGVFHRAFTAKTRLEANQAALKETLATDLMQAMGIESQKARLVPGKYADGSLKLMVEAEHMSMLDAAGQKLSFRDFAGNLRDGILTRPVAGGPARESDPVVEGWGRNKILFLMMADRDAIGSRGDNKGRMGDTFAAIDPGHSLEGFMSFRNVHSDFSFDQPSNRNMRFKNFSMFDDSSYMEKMQGVRQLADMRKNGADMRVFDSYAAWLRDELNGQRSPAEKEELSGMLRRVENMKTSFIARRDYILDEVFGERLRFLDARPPVLEALDALEKLTSPTRMTSPSGEVRLRHPQLAGDRQEWHIREDGRQGYVFSTKGGGDVETDVRDFFQRRLGQAPRMTTEGGRLTLHVPAAELTAFLNVMTEQEVIAAKHQAA